VLGLDIQPDSCDNQGILQIYLYWNEGTDEWKVRASRYSLTNWFEANLTCPQIFYLVQ
jgi:hypothetical protein